jgi:hypothetical protein
LADGFVITIQHQYRRVDIKRLSIGTARVPAKSQFDSFQAWSFFFQVNTTAFA